MMALAALRTSYCGLSLSRPWSLSVPTTSADGQRHAGWLGGFGESCLTPAVHQGLRVFSFYANWLHNGCHLQRTIGSPNFLARIVSVAHEGSPVIQSGGLGRTSSTPPSESGHRQALIRPPLSKWYTPPDHQVKRQIERTQVRSGSLGVC